MYLLKLMSVFVCKWNHIQSHEFNSQARHNCTVRIKVFPKYANVVYVDILNVLKHVRLPSGHS